MGDSENILIYNTWVLPEDYCKKDLCKFNMDMFVSKVGNPCPALGQLPASRILYALVVGKNSTKSPAQDFVHRVAQKLVNPWSIPRQLPPHPMGSCRDLLCSSPLATPDNTVLVLSQALKKEKSLRDLLDFSPPF